MFRQSRDVVLRQTYRPGEKLFVDFAGPSMPITDRLTGEIKPASIFVAVLGYSNYTFACATSGQTTADWLAGQRAALEFIGGVPQAIVPDNPKAMVTRACRYEPDLNPAYQDFARHYGTAVIPARVRRPRDKAKVEGGVLIVERWILARLRHVVFFSLAELNAAIAELTDELNARAFKKLPGNRLSRFIAEERAHLRAQVDRRGTLEDLHPTYGSRSCLPNSQVRPRDSADLASEGRSYQGAYPRVLPGSCTTIALKRCSLTAWASRCLSVFARRRPSKCSANCGP